MSAQQPLPHSAEPSSHQSVAQRERSAGEVVVNALREQVDNLRAQEPGVRACTPEALANARVVTRQIRSMLRGFSRVLRRDVTRPIAEEVKWLAGQLAGEREVQVLIELISEDVRLLPEHVVIGPVIADLRDAAHELGDRGARIVATAVDSARYQALLQALDELIANPPFTGRAERPAHIELPNSLAASVARLDRRLDQARAMPPGRARDVALHEARKADKQVRYMSELVIPLLDEPARRLHRHAEKLQKLLGENQDSVMARSTLLSLGSDAHAKGHSAFTYGLLYGVEYRRAEQALQDVPDRLAKLHDAKTVSWLPAPHRGQSEP